MVLRIVVFGSTVISTKLDHMKFRRKEWIVRPVSMDVGLRLVVAHHYARGASNTRTYLHGLFRKDESFWDERCLGVAWWIPPTKSAALATFSENWKGVLSLSRLVVHPSVPKNGASFLISQSVNQIDREAWPCLVTYADEMQGHTGAIYRATNWDYVGKTSRYSAYSLNGRLMSRKAGPKTRTHKEMLDLGCVFLGKFSKHKFVLK